MRIKVLLLLVTAPATLSGQEPLPPVVIQGLDLLRSGNCDDAFTKWTSTWAEAQKQQMTDSCQVMLDNGGSMHGYDVLKRIRISAHLERIYLLLLYQKQPIYMMLLAYKPNSEWMINAVNWNSDPDKVASADIIPPDR